MCNLTFESSKFANVQANCATASSGIMVSGRTQWPLYFFEAQGACFPSRPLWSSEFGGVQTLASACVLHQPTIVVSEYLIWSSEFRVVDWVRGRMPLES